MYLYGYNLSKVKWCSKVYYNICGYFKHSYLLVSILCLYYTCWFISNYIMYVMFSDWPKRKQSCSIDRILSKTMARQDNGKATVRQQQGKAMASQWQGKSSQRQVKTTARHQESPDAMSRRFCQRKFFDVIQELIFICYSSFFLFLFATQNYMHSLTHNR